MGRISEKRGGSGKVTILSDCVLKFYACSEPQPLKEFEMLTVTKKVDKFSDESEMKEEEEERLSQKIEEKPLAPSLSDVEPTVAAEIPIPYSMQSRKSDPETAARLEELEQELQEAKERNLRRRKGAGKKKLRKDNMFFFLSPSLLAACGL